MQLVGVEARENEKHNLFLIAAEESRNNIPLSPFLVPLSLWHSLTHSPVCRWRRWQQVSSVQRLFHIWAMLRFSGRSGLVLPHTACVQVWLLHQDHPMYPPCGLCWWMGDLIPTRGWNHQAALLPWSCRSYTPGKEWKNPGHTFVSHPWTASMNPSGGDGLGCSSGLGESLTKHLMSLEKFDFFEPRALTNVGTYNNITAVSREEHVEVLIPSSPLNPASHHSSWPPCHIIPLTCISDITC